jgi:hypothetical protein
VFTAQYALSPYIKQTHFVFKGLIEFWIFYTIYFIDACLLYKKITQFTLECALYLYPGQCYVFLTKHDLCVYSLMMATHIS